MDVINNYDAAWNASEVDERRRLFEAALTDDCELVELRGRFPDARRSFSRSTAPSDRFPGAEVDITTDVDEHSGFAQYGWKIVDRNGDVLLDGIDVAERASDGQIRQVVMFSGRLSPSSSSGSSISRPTPEIIARGQSLDLLLRKR